MSVVARFLAIALVATVTTACSGGTDSSPTGPSSPSATQTRIVGLSGNLGFGDVAVGSERTATMTISNSGNSPLTVTSLSVTGGLADQSTASWTRGTIAAGGAQAVTVAFAPTTSGNYSGVITINGDQTSGNNTIAISGNAIGANAAGSWSGAYVVERCDGTGSTQDYFCSTNRGVYPVGSRLPISLNLTQSGANVSGTIFFGQVSGPVNGNVSGAGVLTLQGTATSGSLALQISGWNTRVAGNTMEGTLTYNSTLAGIPGIAVVGVRLSGVTRR